jgi:hypothetical protein
LRQARFGDIRDFLAAHVVAGAALLEQADLQREQREDAREQQQDDRDHQHHAGLAATGKQAFGAHGTSSDVVQMPVPTERT